MKLKRSSDKPRAFYECTLERVAGRWRADAVLRDETGFIVERQVRDAPTPNDAVLAAADALYDRCAWD